MQRHTRGAYPDGLVVGGQREALEGVDGGDPPVPDGEVGVDQHVVSEGLSVQQLWLLHIPVLPARSVI